MVSAMKSKAICLCLLWLACAVQGESAPVWWCFRNTLWSTTDVRASCCVFVLAARELRQSGGVCGAFASASAVATSNGGSASAQSQAVAQSLCNGLKSNDGTSIAQAISTASSSGQAQTVAQAIAEAASGGDACSSNLVLAVAACAETLPTDSAAA